MRRHHAVTRGRRLCVVEHLSINFLADWITMLTIRIYISALTLAFLVLVVASNSLGILQIVVITCAILYLILDVRTDLKALKLELNGLRELEKRVSLLLR
jgi:hypothetical protein